MLAASGKGQDSRSARVLIAGCGDVGSRAACVLREAGAEVFGLRRSSKPLPAGVEAIRADLSDPASLAALPENIDRLVYLPTPDSRTPEAYRRVFVDGLERLLDALDTAKLQRIVFVSSSAVYGDHDGDWVDEETPPQPPGFNGEILLEAEHRLAARGLPATVLRLAGLYGPGRDGLLRRLRAGEARVPVTPFWANRIHVEDAATAIVHLLSLDAPEALYLGVDDTPLTLDVLYGFLAEQLGALPPPTGDAPAGIGNKRLSNARLRASGFVPCWPDARRGYSTLI
ncbi:SDR family oxidoreductase [Oleiagrimonas sp. MCCC 1A03011]|uniref:SDR family oxidoreductase n=1 Tax=Oleiagrimonas sp. MCCC 1A03011 TaxID=1926883 RepID=UPI000DC54A2E|nr:SDR family oxidoreductase [Oleiagrimonas sp. MCCC 1A03011]RAP58543.1 NAD(P)-dependent oxidoreductase [Oleiagrimonas sp. MCCC 1A03011]